MVKFILCVLSLGVGYWLGYGNGRYDEALSNGLPDEFEGI